MAWTIYKSTDGSAPAISGQNYKILDLLDAVLTGPSGDGTGNAYGSTPCAGWSQPFGSSAGKRVYWMGAGARARLYFRVTQLNNVRYADYTGYSTMTDLDNGTDPFPSATPPSQTPSSLYLWVSDTANSTVRSWIIAADERTAIIFVYRDSADVNKGPGWLVTYMGEFFSYAPNDAYQVATLGTFFVNTTEPKMIGNPLGRMPPADVTTPCTGVWVARNFNGEPDSLTANWSWSCYPMSTTFSSISGPFPGVNPLDSKLWMTDIPIVTNRTDVCIRGVLRGLYLPMFTERYYADRDTLSADIGAETLNFLNLWVTGIGQGDTGNNTSFNWFKRSCLLLQTSGTPAVS